jgi:hypothetical protein
MESSPAPRYLEVPIGLAAGLVGLGLLILVLRIVDVAAETSRMPGTTLLSLTGAMAVTGAFFMLVSYRLLMKRGSPVGGGLLSPLGWRALGYMFAGLTVVLLMATWQSRDIKVWGPILFCIAFARWCFASAQRLSKKSASD